MDFYIFAGCALVLFFVVLKILEVKRNSFFKKLASQYQLEFKTPRQGYMKANIFYPTRILEGNIRDKKVRIEDGGSSTLMPSLNFFANVLPQPLFGNGAMRMRTNFYVNDEEVRDVYMKESKIAEPNFVAPKSSIELFLKNL